MNDRLAWLQERQSYLGASDIASLFGVDPYRTATDTFWEKVGPVALQPDTESTMVGRLLEDLLCQYGAKRLGGVAIERSVLVRSSDGIMAANLDARITDRPEGLEAKYGGAADGWDLEEGTDKVPDRVILQAQAQCYAGELERVWVPALIIGYRAQFRLYCVVRHDGLIEKIVAEGHRFWREHVLTKRAPDGSTVPPLEVLRWIRREPKVTVELEESAGAAIEEFEAAKQAAKTAEEQKDKCQAALLALLGTAEAGRLPDGRIVSYPEERSRPSVDTTLLRGKDPALYDLVVKECTRRVLRIREPKGSKKGA